MKTGQTLAVLAVAVFGAWGMYQNFYDVRKSNMPGVVLFKWNARTCDFIIKNRRSEAVVCDVMLSGKAGAVELLPHKTASRRLPYCSGLSGTPDIVCRAP